MQQNLNAANGRAAAQQRFVSERELSPIVGRSVNALQKDRFFGRGPFPYYKVGSSVRYDLQECIDIITASRSQVQGRAA